MILIAVDGRGCHHLTIEVSRRRYNRPDYMEALYNSISMVFKKLKYHKGKNIITITEVDDGATGTDQGEEQAGEAKILEDDASWEQAYMGFQVVSPSDNADKPWNYKVQERPSKGE